MTAEVTVREDPLLDPQRPEPGGLAVVVSVDETKRCRLILSGELDVANAEQLADALEAQLNDGCVDIEIDVARLAFCDSAGLGVLVRGHQQLAARRGSLVLTGVADSHPVAKLLALTGLDTMLTAEDR